MWWTLPFVLCWVVLFLAALASGRGPFLAGLLVFTQVMMLLTPLTATVPALVGDTVVDGTGVTVRRGRSLQHVPWQEITRISFKPSWMSQRLLLHRTSGRPLNLPGPTPGVFTGLQKLKALHETVLARAGVHGPRLAARPFSPGGRTLTVFVAVFIAAGQAVVLALHLVILAPWAQPWWPGRVEATALPDACAVMDRAALTRLVPDALLPDRDESRLPHDRYCEWGAEVPSLSIRMAMSKRYGNTDGDAPERAHEAFVSRNDGTCPTRVPNLGDEACVGTELLADGANEVRVVARRHNVLVTLTYRADRPAGELTGELVPLIRTVLGRIHFE